MSVWHGFVKPERRAPVHAFTMVEAMIFAGGALLAVLVGVVASGVAPILGGPA
jgi:hypothetical protein